METVYNTKDGNFVNVTIKGDKLEYFVPGEGWKKTKKFKNIGTVERTNDWYEVTNIYRKFGLYVASWSCSLMTVYGTGRTYPILYNNWRTALEQKGFSEQVIKTCLSIISPDYMLALFGITAVDVVGLDNKFNIPDNISMSDYLKNQYGSDVALAISLCLFL